MLQPASILYLIDEVPHGRSPSIVVGFDVLDVSIDSGWADCAKHDQRYSEHHHAIFPLSESRWPQEFFVHQSAV